MNDNIFNSEKRVANAQDIAPVTVCFADPAIADIFAELVRSRGVPVIVAPSISDIQGETRVITEPTLFPALPANYRPRTLLVGTKENVKDLPARALTKPLTEEKVECAMDDLLRS